MPDSAAPDEPARRARLEAAEAKALDLLSAIRAAGLVRPGASETQIDAGIAEIAAADFGISRNWHKRLVRAGANTVCVFADMPPVRTISEDDTAYLDLGPVFGEWEADVGETWAVGADPAKHALVAALPDVFAEVTARARAHPDIAGAGLYDFACRAAAARGYHFGGRIAGHTIGEFPHLTWPGEKAQQLIAPGNDTALTAPDHLGRPRHWIVEVHLLEPGRTWGGFYERLLRV
ncbi:MAG: M24 family metallopeptidase [Hyphomonas sp.]|nr:M24 family metallopeptidase [Hyphomonas sp.]